MRRRLPRALWLATAWALGTWTLVAAITAAIVTGLANGVVR